MVTKQQFMNGIISYIDHQVIPLLPTGGKWSLGAAVILASNRSSQVIDQLSKNQLLKTLGAINQNGMIDEQSLANALIGSSQKYGKIQISIPLVGTLSFSGQDIGRAKLYIAGGI